MRDFGATRGSRGKSVKLTSPTEDQSLGSPPVLLRCIIADILFFGGVGDGAGVHLLLFLLLLLLLLLFKTILSARTSEMRSFSL